LKRKNGVGETFLAVYWGGWKGIFLIGA